MKVLLSSFHLNCHSLGFPSQTWKLKLRTIFHKLKFVSESAKVNYLHGDNILVKYR